MGSKPSLYAELIDDPLYLTTVVNTLLFAGLGVNVMMFLALLLSGFFMRRRWWIKALLVVYILPWALAEVQAFISIHWMLVSEMGLVNRVLESCSASTVRSGSTTAGSRSDATSPAISGSGCRSGP